MLEVNGRRDDEARGVRKSTAWWAQLGLDGGERGEEAETQRVEGWCSSPCAPASQWDEPVAGIGQK